MRKLVITLFCITLLIPSRGNTLGLGEIELQSSLNEELKAEIALTSVGQESAETIIVKLASRKEFTRAGLDRPFILNDLKFAVKLRNGQPYIEVTSKKAIREPFLSFLIDIDWPRGHILREFTMLLDPPVFMQATPEGTPTKAVVAPQTTAPVDSTPVLDQPGYSVADTRNNQALAPSAPVANVQQPYQAPVAPTQTQQQTRRFAQAYQMPADAYRVQKGDTAWKIAERLRAGDVSVEQMMMALLRRNPEAFIKDNINGVKRGYILRMPSQQEVQSLSNQTALLQVKEQYALWREYRQALVAKRTGNKIDRDRTDDTSAEQQTDSQGRLTIASAAEKEGSMGTTSGAQNPEAELKQLRQDLAATTEELESGKLENAELKERISSLQTRMKKMERLLNLKDGDLAKLQSDIEPTAPVAEDSATPMAEMQEQPAAEMVPAEADMTADETAPGMTDQTTPDLAAETPADLDAISSTQPADDAVFKDEMTADQMAPLEPMPQTPAVIPPAQPVDLGKTDSKDMLEEFLTDPKSLPILAGSAILVLVLVLMIVMRRKKAKAAATAAAPVAELPETGDFNFDEMADIAEEDDGGFNDAEEQDLSDKLDAFAEEAEAEAADTMSGDEDVISLDEDQPAEEETPKDDVLAEADVYLAYGIYQQAEELLKSAVAENPGRNDYKGKLLETYFASKDKAGFNNLAENLKAAIDNESPEWQRVVAMGRELDSGNALYSGSDVPDFDVDNLLPQKPDTDFDLGDAAADFDLGESIDGEEEFDLGLDDESLDDEIPATVALSPEEAENFDLGDSALDEADNFALNDDGMDELDQELANAGIDENENLDFGLDEVAAGTASEEAEEEIDDNFSLDFEMADLGLDEADAEVSVEETEAIATSMEPEIEEGSLDLADSELDMDLGEDLTAESNDIDLNDADEVSLDMADDVSLDMGDIDLGDIDLSAEDSSDESPADVELDMGDLDVGDLDADIDLADDDATVVRSMAEDDEPIDISSLPEDLDEVNTKLDLARAYIDMGDNDGASDILREVIEEAGDAQKAEAEELLKNIA